jgi:chromosome partitioning protein
MIVLTVTNTKGGTGKTTSTVSLAGALAEAGRVLVIDLDPQGSATRWLHGPERGDGGREVARQYQDRPLRVLTSDLPIAEAIVETDHAGIDLLPGNATLEQAARTLASEPGGDSALASLLRNDLDADRYHFVLIDTPPTTGTLSSSALLAADALLIPVEARHLGLEGLARILTTTQRLARRLNRDIPVAAVLVCRLDRRNQEAPMIASQVREFLAAQHPGVPVHELRENVRLSTAASAHIPITLFDARAAGAIDYRRVAADLVDRFG